MSQTYRLCEIKENNGKNGKPVWVVIKGVVYDLTKFLKEHPGGDDSILDYAGKDATKAFNQVGHSTDAIRDMKLYKIGTVASECSTYLQTENGTTATTTTTNVITTTPKPINSSTTTTVSQENPTTNPKQCCGMPEEKPIKFCFCC